MNIHLIGSNGSLATSIGKYCNSKGHHLDVFGRSMPKNYQFDQFISLDLMTDSLDNPELYKADVLIYAAGAGVQSYFHDSENQIYKLNAEVPIKLHQKLSQSNMGGQFSSLLAPILR